MSMIYMPQAVKSNLLLYADDSCLMYQHKDFAIIEKNLTKILKISVIGLLIKLNQFFWQVSEGLSILVN